MVVAGSQVTKWTMLAEGCDRMGRENRFLDQGLPDDEVGARLGREWLRR